MLDQGISGLPVVENGELVGIITMTDLTKGVAKFGG
jgi:CBS domain-containing protein